METQGTILAPGVIRFERRLRCPLQEVWAWITESDKRGQWLATGEMELVEGGRVSLHFRHNDLSSLPGTPPDKYKELTNGHSFTGTILRINPPHLLTFTWEGGSEVTFELTESGDHVLLILTHRLLPGDIESQASVLAGWHTHLDIFMAALLRQTPPNFWVRHAQLEKEYAAALSCR
jgi:uncharacterized protein YndB with AHSA1/START domain